LACRGKLDLILPDLIMPEDEVGTERMANIGENNFIAKSATIKEFVANIKETLNGDYGTITA